MASGVDTEFPYRVRTSSIGGLIAATLFADTVSDSQIFNYRCQNFSSHAFRAPPGLPRKIPGYPAKKVGFSLVLRDIPNLLAPPHSRGRPPPQPKISGPKSLGLCSFSLPEIKRCGPCAASMWTTYDSHYHLHTYAHCFLYVLVQHGHLQTELLQRLLLKTLQGATPPLPHLSALVLLPL